MSTLAEAFELVSEAAQEHVDPYDWEVSFNSWTDGVLQLRLRYDFQGRSYGSVARLGLYELTATHDAKRLVTVIVLDTVKAIRKEIDKDQAMVSLKKEVESGRIFVPRAETEVVDASETAESLAFLRLKWTEQSAASPARDRLTEGTATDG